MSPETKKLKIYFPFSSLFPPTEDLYDTKTPKIVGDGWLDPDGGFYSCGPDQHVGCARYILEKDQQRITEALSKSGLNEDLGEWPPRTLVEKAGYILVNQGMVNFWTNHPPTLHQIQRLQKSAIMVPKVVEKNVAIEDFQTLAILLENDQVGEEFKPFLEKFLAHPGECLRFWDVSNFSFAYAVYQLLSSGFSEYKRWGIDDVLQKQQLEVKDCGAAGEYKISPSGKLVLIFEGHVHRIYGEPDSLETRIFLLYPRDIGVKSTSPGCKQ